MSTKTPAGTAPVKKLFALAPISVNHKDPGTGRLVAQDFAPGAELTGLTDVQRATLLRLKRAEER